MAKKIDPVTKELRRGKQHLIPSRAKPENGSTTREERAHNEIVDQYTRSLRQAADMAKKGLEVQNWLFDDIYKSLNPKNNGKVEEIWVDNPDFDPSKPPSEDNPFLIVGYRHMYEPTRYKENTISAAVKEQVKNHDRYIEKVQDREKQVRIQLAKDAREVAAEGKGDGSKVVDIEESGPLISIDWEDEAEPTVN